MKIPPAGSVRPSASAVPPVHGGAGQPMALPTGSDSAQGATVPRVNAERTGSPLPLLGDIPEGYRFQNAKGRVGLVLWQRYDETLVLWEDVQTTGPMSPFVEVRPLRRRK